MTDRLPDGSARLTAVILNPDVSLVVARQRGLFADAGLVVDVVTTPSSTRQMQALVDGAAHLAFTAFDNVLAWSGRGGTEVVAVAQVHGVFSQSLWARPGTASIAALRGQRLGADAPDTASALVMRRVLLEHGLDTGRGDYEIVAVGGGEARLASMRRGKTSAAMLMSPVDRAAAEAGLVKLADARDILPSYPGGVVLAAARDWAADHRSELTRFLRAWLAGGRWAADHPEAAAELLAAESGKPAPARLRLPMPFTRSGDGLASLRTVLDVRVGLGLTPACGEDLERYVALEYLEAAVADLG